MIITFLIITIVSFIAYFIYKNKINRPKETTKLNKQIDEANLFNSFDKDICKLTILASKTKNPDEKITYYTSAIHMLIGLKYKQPTIYKKYYAHCHNSCNKDFDYIEYLEQKRNEVQKNRDNYLEKERQFYSCEHFKENGEQVVLNVLLEKKGIKQTDFYKLFDDDVKSSIQEILYNLDKNNVIKRTKSGNTYILDIK